MTRLDHPRTEPEFGYGRPPGWGRRVNGSGPLAAAQSGFEQPGSKTRGRRRLLWAVSALAPSILVMMTSFVRIIVVFSFLRQAMGTQQSSPTRIIIGLALFLTFYIMLPVWQSIESAAFKAHMANEITQREAFRRGMEPSGNSCSGKPGLRIWLCSCRSLANSAPGTSPKCL